MAVRVRRGVYLLGVALGCLVMVPGASAAPPANDDFANAQALSGPLPTAAAGSNVEATKEVGEHGPWGYFDFEPAGSSVWFSWEASVSGWVTASTCGSGFNSLLDVYTGPTLFNLQRAAPKREGLNFDCPPGGSQVTFKAVAGTNYKLRVDGNLSLLPPPATEGSIALAIELVPNPANDDFAAAQTVVAESLEGGTFFRVDVPGFNWNATKEADEPAHAGNQGGASVWYSWTAPVSGRAKVVATSGAFGTQLGEQNEGLLGVYTGSSLGALTPVGVLSELSRPEVSLQATAGTTYKVAVDGWFDALAGSPKMGQISFLIYLEVPGSLPPPDYPALDTTSPETRVSKLYLMRKPPVLFALRLRSSEPGSTFRCRFDRRPFRTCGRTQGLRGRGPGRHRFEAFAVDAAGNADPTPAVVRFGEPKLKPKETPAKGKR